MSALAGFFGALSRFFEYRASAKELAARIERLEAQQVQMRTDMAKCKMMVGLNQLTDVTPAEV